MSFDLYFYKRKNDKLTEAAIAEYLNKNLPFNNSDYAKQWCYENPETGVYFDIDWNEPNTEDEDIKIWDSFDELEYLNFSLSINFFRPRYFGIEIFPVIERIINELDLYILDQQDEIDPDNPRKFENGYLQQQWMRHNDQLSKQYFKELNLEYMPLEKSNYLWCVKFHRTEIQDSLTEDIYVPAFFILKSDEDGRLYTACVWPTHIPVILPEVEYVIIKKSYKTIFKTVEESGLVSYKTILAELGDYFEDFTHTIPNLKVLRQYNANRMKSKFNKLKILKAINEFGVSVGAGGFVNVLPE